MALQESYFAVIGRENYRKCLYRIEQKALSKKMDFFRHIPFLQHWTRNQLARLVDSFTERNYLRNQTVYEQYEKADMIYIVLEGELEAVRTRRPTQVKNMGQDRSFIGPEH